MTDTGGARENAVSEGAALAATVRASDPAAPTACAGWTVHDIVAHLTAGSKEIADLIEERLGGTAPRDTREFEDRERPYRDMADDALRAEWAEQVARKNSATRALETTGQDSTFSFTGTELTARQIRTHSRSEAAIHRWDIAGDDDAASLHLTNPELTAHAVSVLNSMPILADSVRQRFERAPRLPFTIALRAPSSVDVVMAADASGAVEVSQADGSTECDARIDSDAAQRLLTLWGRRSSQRSYRVVSSATSADTIESMLWADASHWPA